MDKKPADSPKEPDAESLDKTATTVEGQDDGVIHAEGNQPQSAGPAPKQSLNKRLVAKLLGSNIYLLLFVFVIVLAGAISFASYNYSKHKSKVTTINSTTLSQDALNQLASGDVSVGSSGQILNVQGSAVFSGTIVARGDLQVAGKLQLGSALSLPDLTVNDTSNLGQVTVSKNLAVTGTAGIQGAVTIGSTLQVAGSGSFSGAISAPQVTTGNLSLNGDLVLTHHLITGGGTPARSGGTALGSGGSATVSGNDIAGTATINTGSGTSAGCFITVTFTKSFNNIPHVLVTPIGSAAGGIAMYVNRSTKDFSICTSSAAPSSANFAYDYFVVD